MEGNIDELKYLINYIVNMLFESREEIWWRNLYKCLNIFQKKYSYDWVLAVKRDLISIINIENKLSRQLPELYLHLFKDLINYAINNK
ncbi:hypothetical protein Gotur_018418, partial [Gossypium turneri]